jgi:hypothetical protein
MGFVKIPKCICASLLPSFLRDQKHSQLMCYEHFHHLFVGQSWQGTIELWWCAMPQYFWVAPAKGIQPKTLKKRTFVVDNPSLGNTYIFRQVVTFSSMLLACHSNGMKLIWKSNDCHKFNPRVGYEYRSTIAGSCTSKRIFIYFWKIRFVN